MFGPHFYYDLIRLARKRRNIFLRCGYLLALLLAWWFVYEEHTVTQFYLEEIRRQTSKYSNALLMFQYLLILLGTPIYMAGTIMEEKENRTLELLFQTDLSDQEILLGKFAARLMQLLVLAPAALPMLGLIHLWGGIGFESLIVHFFFSVLVVVCLGTISMWASSVASSFPKAAAFSYGIIFVAAIALWACGVLLMEDTNIRGFVRPYLDDLEHQGVVTPRMHMIVLAIMSVPLLLGIIVFYLLALWQMRRLRELKWIKERVGKSGKVKDEEPKDFVARWSSAARVIPDNAIAWKEMRRGRDERLYEAVIWVLLAVVFIGGGLHLRLMLAHPAGGDPQAEADVFRVLFNLGYLGVTAAALLTQAISRRRPWPRARTGTLDFLLLLPMERSCSGGNGSAHGFAQVLLLMLLCMPSSAFSAACTPRGLGCCF